MFKNTEFPKIKVLISVFTLIISKSRIIKIIIKKLKIISKFVYATHSYSLSSFSFSNRANETGTSPKTC